MQESDPWCVQDSKGRVRPAKPEPSGRTLACFLPPGLGLSAIAPKESPTERISEVPKEKPSEQPELVEQPGAGALSRDELEKGLDLIQGLLDEQMAESEKRERALELAKAACVPWLPKPPENDFPVRRHLSKRSRRARWCSCDGADCEGSGDETGF